MKILSERLLHTILRALLLTSLIEECLESGDFQTANFLCKSTMPYWCNIPKRKRMKLSGEFSRGYEYLLNWQVLENLKSPSA